MKRLWICLLAFALLTGCGDLFFFFSVKMIKDIKNFKKIITQI